MKSSESKGLSLGFTICCFVDLFGVFPIITLARVIIECGWLGFPLALIVMLVQIYTALLLGKCWVMAERISPSVRRKTRYPYAALAEVTFGSKMSNYITLILSLTIFGADILNIIIASQNMKLLGVLFLPEQFTASFCTWMILIGIFLCPLMWLGSPKDMKWLTGFSMLTVLTVSILTWLCIMDDPRPVVRIPDPSFEAIAIAFGVLSFQFDIHPMLLTVQVDMKDKKKLGAGVFCGFIVIGWISLITVLLCYELQGTAVDYNVLKGLAASPTLYAALILVTLQVCISTVVGSTALFQQVEHKLGIHPEFGWKRMLVRSSIIGLAVMVGESMPRLDLVMGLVGATMTSQIMFIWPIIFYRRLRALSSPVPKENPRLITPIQPSKYGSIPAYPHNPSCPPMALVLSPSTDGSSYEDYLSYPSTSTNLHKPTPSTAPHFSSLIDTDSPPEGPMTACQKVFSSSLILLGILAAVTSAYYSTKGAVEYADYTPPCIENFTYFFM